MRASCAKRHSPQVKAAGFPATFNFVSLIYPNAIYPNTNTKNVAANPQPARPSIKRQIGSSRGLFRFQPKAVFQPVRAAQTARTKLAAACQPSHGLRNNPHMIQKASCDSAPLLRPFESKIVSDSLKQFYDSALCRTTVIFLDRENLAHITFVIIDYV